jgi:hypothetical protein
MTLIDPFRGGKTRAYKSLGAHPGRLVIDTVEVKQQEYFRSFSTSLGLTKVSVPRNHRLCQISLLTTTFCYVGRLLRRN